MLVSIAVGALVLVFFVVQAQKKTASEVVENAGQVLNVETSSGVLTNGTETARLRYGTDTLLIIGTDRIEGKDGTSPKDGYSFNYDLADFLVLLVIDNYSKTVQPIQINRDTVTKVPWIAINGGLGGFETEQITYAHTYGSGGKDSCENTALAVSKFLFEVPIDRYISITMDAVPIVNDLVGGVTIECQDSIPSLGEEYVPGALITLKGRDALRFLRYRDRSLTDSNMKRMERHRLYLEAFAPQAKKAIEKDESVVLKILEKTEDYIVSDMSGNEITDTVTKLDTYEILPSISYAGTYKQGEYAEFYADMDSVWECVTEALC